MDIERELREKGSVSVTVPPFKPYPIPNLRGPLVRPQSVRSSRLRSSFWWIITMCIGLALASALTWLATRV